MPQPLLPGIYETSPYTGIVLVPGPCPDDRAVFGLGPTPGLAMPTIKPNLKFIPRTPSPSKREALIDKRPHGKNKP